MTDLLVSFRGGPERAPRDPDRARDRLYFRTPRPVVLKDDESAAAPITAVIAFLVALLDYFIGPLLRLSECDSERLRGLEIEG
jgi:hypothetical protein